MTSNDHDHRRPLTMTRKDYQLIADAIADTASHCKDQQSLNALDYLVQNLNSDLKRDNPNFDAHRFRAACFNRKATK